MMDMNALASEKLARGFIRNVLQTGEIIVTSADGEGRILCDFLHTSHGPPPVLSKGDPVLFLPPASVNDKGIVLGRIGSYQPPDLDHRTIDAAQTLTLRCGESSIVLRKDGKILTRAVDIATIANRTHRIKGGSVEIN